MLSKLYSRRRAFNFASIVNVTRCLVSSPSANDGVASRVNNLRDLSVDDEFGGFSCYDFDLANLNSVGVDNLQTKIMPNFDIVGISETLNNLEHHE